VKARGNGFFLDKKRFGRWILGGVRIFILTKGKDVFFVVFDDTKKCH
jgi:hypothetical protein